MRLNYDGTLKNYDLFAAIEDDYFKVVTGELSEEEAREYFWTTFKYGQTYKQSEEGIFWIAVENPEDVPNDIITSYVYETTYMMTAIYMYFAVNYKSLANDEIFIEFLERALKASLSRKLMGTGAFANEDFCKAMKIFANAGLNDFLKEYGDAFTEVKIAFDDAIDYLRKIASEEVSSSYSWTNNKDLARDVLEVLDGDEKKSYIFVYGTLMKNQAAHRLLLDAEYIGDYKLEDYAMYNLGSYPGVRPCEGESVFGEVYRIDNSLISRLDRYEGEGVLYTKKKVFVRNSWSKQIAYIYVYNNKCEDRKKPMREPWNAKESDYVWYAAYGSNIDENRFSCYLKGGVCVENGKTYVGCKDKSIWKDTAVKTFKGQMYFGNNSPSWGGKGVAFYDPSVKSETIMKLYLITRDQFHDIQRQEGLSDNWYGRIVFLEADYEGAPIYTITSEKRRPEVESADNYYQLVGQAIQSI